MTDCERECADAVIVLTARRTVAHACLAVLKFKRLQLIAKPTVGELYAACLDFAASPSMICCFD